MPNEILINEGEDRNLERKVAKGGFKELFGPCNSKVNLENKCILLYDKDSVCNLLKLAEENLPTFTYTGTNNSCLNISRPASLVGFFIKAEGTWNNKSLVLEPVYAGQEENHFIEAITILATLNAVAKGVVHPSFPSLVFKIPFQSTTFNHNILQFHPDAANNEFMKSFISWYELKCIVDHCDYLGISGSIVMTGNIGTNGMGNSQLLTGHENTGYFTYRVIGFKERTYPFPKFPNEIKDADKSKILIKSNSELKSNGTISYNFDIPTETWAVPCPPMWKPN